MKTEYIVPVGLVFVVLLSMVACGSPTESTPDSDPATSTETLAPARGDKFIIIRGSRYNIREWQHPRTGCWYLVGTAGLEGITPLNDANGQICEPVANPSDAAVR